MNGRLICASADRAFRGDNGNVLRHGSGDGGLRARFDDADDGQQGMMQPQRIERRRGSRIARYDETANAPLQQCGRTLQGVAQDRFGALGAVGQSCGIAQIDEILCGHRQAQCAQYRQSADPRIEHADRDTRLAAQGFKTRGACEGTTAHPESRANSCTT
jgi:hypothetical protein